MLTAIIFLSTWCLAYSVSTFSQSTTEIIGVPGSGTQNPPLFSSTLIISQISPTFDSLGLTSISICYKILIPRGDGAVYSNISVACTLYGTASGANTTQKFTADEWPTNILPCISKEGVIVGLNISTNRYYYWTAGKFTNCNLQSFTYPAADGAQIAIYGISTTNRPSSLPPGIGSLQLSYFYCAVGATDCPSSLYNGGGTCGTRNGGCDLGVNCKNVPGSLKAACGPCQTGFSLDSMNVCRPISGPATYNLTGSQFPFNDHPNGTAFNASLPFLPPYKLSALTTQFQEVVNSSVITLFALQFTKVALGTYVANSTQVTSVDGFATNQSPLVENQTILFGENEWIVNFSTRIVPFFYGGITYQAIGSINISTNLRPIQLNAGNTDPVFEFQNKSLNGQIIVTFNGTSGATIDNVNFLGASCTSNCPAEPYGSGFCATKPVSQCVGGFCQDTSTSWTCACYSGYTKFNDSLCLPTFDFCGRGSCATGVSCQLNAGPLGYECGECPSGYVGSGYTQCQDIDECVTGKICSIFATCTNVPGTYDCSCNEFYFGNGTYCSPLCGDGMCDSSTENCVTCPIDCNQTFCHVCGDGQCDILVNETCNSCPNDCGVCAPKLCDESTCSNHGTCFNGDCACNPPWTGPTCTDKTEVISVDVQNNVSITFNQVLFQIAITKIVEYDAKMNPVQELFLDPGIFEFAPNVTSESNNKQWNFGTQLQNTAVLNVTIWQFEESPYSYFTFAKTQLKFPPHTIKFTFQLSSWPFQNAANFLGIEISTFSGTPSSSSSSPVSPGESVQWVSLTSNGASLYAQFNTLALIDGRVRNITYAASDKNMKITAMIPHFWYTAVVDPDYSVLVAQKGKNGISSTVIIAVVVPIFIVVILVALLIKFWGRISTKRAVTCAQEGADLQIVGTTDNDSVVTRM